MTVPYTMRPEDQARFDEFVAGFISGDTGLRQNLAAMRQLIERLLNQKKPPLATLTGLFKVYNTTAASDFKIRAQTKLMLDKSEVVTFAEMLVEICGQEVDRLGVSPARQNDYLDNVVRRILETMSEEAQASPSTSTC